MPAPIPDDTRAAILDDIKTRQKSCRGIARDHGVSTATVRKIAKDNGITDAFSREQTIHATRARQADIGDLRSRLALRNYLRAHAVHDRLDAEVYEAKHVTGEGKVITVRTEHPPARDERDLAAAISSYTAAADRLTDDDGGADHAKSLLGALAEGLAAAAQALDEPADDAAG